MSSSDTNLLAINAGSSSIRFALFANGTTLRRILEGRLEGIGLAESTLKVDGDNPGDRESRRVDAPNHSAAVDVLMGWFEEHRERVAFSAVGHRVVHGGPRLSAPQRITEDVLDALQALSPFAPKHLPEEILLARAFQRRFPSLPQVACFDTAFHHDLPRVARLLPIPRRFEAQGVRKYGFHGLSYTFLMSELARLDGQAALKGRVVFAHLGNGASLAAVRDGKPMDTSMSFTPTSGVPMGTRSGDLDPGLLTYLLRDQKLSAAQLDAIVNSESGLLGMSETSSDMRELLKLEVRDIRAAEAVAVFCYQIKKWIGAFAAALGGLDTLVFAGGIGENSPVVRSRICEGLSFLGIQLDRVRNATNEPVISALAGPTVVRVIKTDEERTIAEMTCDLLGVGRTTGTSS
jgi:acetate kinase